MTATTIKHIPASQDTRSGSERFPRGGRNTLLAAVVSFTGLLIPAAGAEEAPAWAGTAKTAPAGLLDVAQTKRRSLFFTEREVGGKVVPKIGFFIGADGLALCPLQPLSWKVSPQFMMEDGEGTVLPQPVVLAVFPEQGLALVKFAFKPGTWLKISKEPTSVGTWLAVLSPSFAPNPVLGPIVAHREMSNIGELVPPRPPLKQFSVAASHSPDIAKVFVEGAPLLDARGEVVAAFSGSQPMPGQTLRIASPLAVLLEPIQEAVKQGKRLETPLSAKDLQMDPAALSEEASLFGAAIMQEDFAKGREIAKALVTKFPNSSYARNQEYIVEQREVDLGKGSAKKLVELAEQFKLRDDSPPWERAAYHCRLGEALGRANRADEAIVHLKKSDELWPKHMACMSLAFLFDKTEQWEDAEYYWRRTTSLDQERIEYWNALNLVLASRLKFKEAREASDRARFLEQLYSNP